MDTHLQFGHGMMALSRDLTKKWQGGLVILSPRDLDLAQMSKFSEAIENNGAQIIIDPQFYIPRADHYRLTSHSFWPSDYDSAFFDRSGIEEMLTKLKTDYNDELNSKFYLLPGIKTTIVNDDWYNFQEMILTVAKQIEHNKEIYITLCLSKELMNSEDDLHNLLEYLDELDYDGCYLVPEPPENSYLIENPIWLLNLLDISAGLKLQNKKVIVGYSNHQHLLLALAKVDGIASGSWLNTRTFKPKKINNPEQSDKRRSKWYYCPQALSEYQIPFLDMAKRQGLLNHLKTSSSYNSKTASILFSGAQPSTVNYGERDSFAHYLHCLKVQSENLVKPTYELTKNSLNMELETSRLLTEELKRSGIIGRDRDFSNVVDISMATISAFNSIRGLSMNHQWDSI